MAKTALITGASSGIGYALAKLFSKEKYQVIAIGRDQESLYRLLQECNSEFKSSVITLIKDLGKQESVDEILIFLKQKKINVDVLINNAGFGLWGPFNDVPIEKAIEMVNVHICALLKLTYYVLPYMIKNSNGHILNVGSVYSYTPVAYQIVYAATKSFMRSFTRGLKYELKHQNINITLLCPGSTHTQFRKRLNLQERSYFGYLTAEEVANAGFSGLMKNKDIVIPGLLNKLFVQIISRFPLSVIDFIVYKFRRFKRPKLA